MYDLKKANINRSPNSRETFEGDLKPGGDLALIAANQAYAKDLESLSLP